MYSIVIPIYKKELSLDEKLSFRQVLNVFSDSKIIICTYKELSLIEYQKISADCWQNLVVEFFPEKYFKSVAGYNLLMLSKFFYVRFSQYSHVLIYQLDAFVFNNNLSDFCSLNIDYIGAPVFYNDNKEPSWLGNGGLSLRRINSFIDSFKGFNWYKQFILLNWANSATPMKGYLKTPVIILQAFVMKYGIPLLLPCTLHEDLIWSCMPKLKKATYEQSYSFAFEKNPSILYTLNNKRLPFGCHAWFKYEFNSFWFKYIPLY